MIDRIAVLISIQTIWHSDSVPERCFEKVDADALHPSQLTIFQSCQDFSWFEPGYYAED